MHYLYWMEIHLIDFDHCTFTTQSHITELAWISVSCWCVLVVSSCWRTISWLAPLWCSQTRPGIGRPCGRGRGGPGCLGTIPPSCQQLSLSAVSGSLGRFSLAWGMWLGMSFQVGEGCSPLAPSFCAACCRSRRCTSAWNGRNFWHGDEASCSGHSLWSRHGGDGSWRAC